MSKRDGILYRTWYDGMCDRFEVLGYKPRQKTWELIDALPEPLFFALANGIRSKVDGVLEDIANGGFSPSPSFIKTLKAIQKRERREGIFKDKRIDTILAKHEQGVYEKYAEYEQNV